MIIVYIAHPVAGNITANLKSIRNIVSNINKKSPSVVPLVPYYVDVLVLERIGERKRGIKNSIAILKSGMIDELWLYGNCVSPGMEAEIDIAHEMDIDVVPRTEATIRAYMGWT